MHGSPSYQTIWLLICTLTAGWQKVFSANPKVGFLAHADRYRTALEQGELLAPAKSIDQMQQIIFNDYVDASLAFLFMFVVVSVLFFGIRTILSARNKNRPSVDEAPSESFPPALSLKPERCWINYLKQDATSGRP